MTPNEFRERERERWPRIEALPPRDMSGVEWLRSMRGVKRFTEFPERVQRIYLEVAKCFPNAQVYACGSRVRGDYVEAGDGNDVRGARRRAGMKDKAQSDFDFFIPDGQIEAKGKLPPNTERVRARVPLTELVEIPIHKSRKK